jgi:glycerophosphoryl diester phosphodiesterase
VLEALSREPFAVVGHRGAAGEAPENTLKALRRAIESGADAAEFDVRATSDGFLVVFHDEDTSRLTGRRLVVSSATLGELRKLSVMGERIPLLEELLGEASGRIPLLLELKVPSAAEALVEAVSRAGLRSEVMVISFHPEAIKSVKELDPGLATGLIYARPPGMVVECKRIGCQAVLPRYNLATEKAIGLAHRLGLRVIAWTVNDTTTASRLVSRGVDAIATDYPTRMVKLRESLGKA